MLKKGELPYPEKGKKNFADKDSEYREDYDAAMGPVLQSLFLLTPVISTTFASVQRFLDGVAPGTIGLLIVDESGQASPQMALGAMYRSRAAVIVGDPKQVEPVVTDELDLLKKSYEKNLLYVPYTQKGNSVQTFADKLNHFGTYLRDPGNEGRGTWVGSPLVVHRRCISPMYDISNVLSYNGIMKKASIEPPEKKKALFWQPKSLWLNVKGPERGAKNHFVEKQADYIFHILQTSFRKYGEAGKEPDIFIISPFKTVADGMKSYLRQRRKELGTPVWDAKKLQTWMGTHIGTVHTFQGQGAQEVIFFPGCSDTTKEGTLQFVNANIVNVAVTRAKSRLYVVGDWDTWAKNANFKVMQNVMANRKDETDLYMTPAACAERIGLSVEEWEGKPAEKEEKPVETEAVAEDAAKPSQPVCPAVAEKKEDYAAMTRPQRGEPKPLPQEKPVTQTVRGPLSRAKPAGDKKRITGSFTVPDKPVPVAASGKSQPAAGQEILCPFCRDGYLVFHQSRKVGRDNYWKCSKCGAYAYERNGKLDLRNLRPDKHQPPPLCPHCGRGRLQHRMGNVRPYWRCSNPYCGYMYGDIDGKVNYKEEVAPNQKKKEGQQ